MPKFNFIKVQIRASELNTHIVVVAPWEVSVLQALYGEDAAVVGEQEVSRELPDAADEFSRLASRYGPRNADMPVVASVYGNYGPGVNALAKEIKATVIIGSRDAKSKSATAEELGLLTGDKLEAELAAASG